MNYLYEIGFWIHLVLYIVAIYILVSAVRHRGKRLLLGYFISSVLISAGSYIPSLLLRNEVMTIESYQRLMGSDIVVLALTFTGLLGTALLVAFVFDLKFNYL